MLGTETEFGIYGGWSLARANAIQESVAASQPTLPAVKGGVFLANGARVYVDFGRHNEYATPETHDPAALVRHELAGRELMAQAAARHQLSLLCSNFDPHTRSTWGTHENYEVFGLLDSRKLDQLYTHLVTRIIYTGAGGIDPDHAGVRLILSPRANQMRAAHSEQGIHCRSLIFTKPDHYGQHLRLHVFCGESLLSQTANYLKYATTALVVHCLQADLDLERLVFADGPLQILSRLNRDLSLTATYPLSDGRELTAIAIQRELWCQVSQYTPQLPIWAPTALQRWGEMLDALEATDASLNGKLDWLIYHRLCQQLIAEHSFTPKEVRQLNRQITHTAFPQTTIKSDSVKRVDHLRAAAAELYIKLHIVGRDSLFEAIDQPGQLAHRLPEITPAAIQAAIHTPPPGRATNRSRIIEQFKGESGQTLNWHMVHDIDERRAPIPEDKDWDGILNWQPEHFLPYESGIFHHSEIRNRALKLYLARRYDDAEKAYHFLVTHEYELPSTYCHLARLYYTNGRETEALEAVDHAWLYREQAPDYVLARIHFLKALGALLNGQTGHPELCELAKVLNTGCETMEWTMQPVLDQVKIRLPPAYNDLLELLVTAQGEDWKRDELSLNELWKSITSNMAFRKQFAGCLPLLPV